MAIAKLSALNANAITPATISKYIFHVIKHEELYIHIIILKVNA